MEYLGYHGTILNTNRLRLQNASPQSFVGKGLYFTDCLKDAESHASPNNPDNSHKISNTIDRHVYGLKRKLSYQRATEIAERKFSGSSVFLARLEINNPLHLDYNRPHYIQRNRAARFFNLLAKAEEQWYGAKDKLSCGILDGMKTTDFISGLHGLELKYQTRLIRSLGFDGVIFHDAAEFWPSLYTAGSTHYVVYKERQVKSQLQISNK